MRYRIADDVSGPILGQVASALRSPRLGAATLLARIVAAVAKAQPHRCPSEEVYNQIDEQLKVPQNN